MSIRQPDWLSTYAPSLREIQEARQRLTPVIRDLPMMAADHEDREIRFKTESLQPLGSFKLRAGLTAAAKASEEGIGRVVTASAGNFAQGLGLGCRIHNLALEVHVPDSAAKNKVESILKTGATVIDHPFDEWWSIMQTRNTGHTHADNVFVHPVAEREVLLGNATIGLEIASEWPEAELVIAPFGGGGLTVGLSAGLRAAGAEVDVIASEVESSAPLSAAFTAGEPVPIQRTASFVDGIGSSRVLDEMWPLIQSHIRRSEVVSIEETAEAFRRMLLVHKLVVEGAAATAYAAALRPEYGGRRIVVILSGSNVDAGVVARLLSP